MPESRTTGTRYVDTLKSDLIRFEKENEDNFMKLDLPDLSEAERTATIDSIKSVNDKLSQTTNRLETLQGYEKTHEDHIKRLKTLTEDHAEVKTAIKAGTWGGSKVGYNHDGTILDKRGRDVTPGEAVTSQDSYKSFAKMIAPDGIVSPTQRIPRIQFDCPELKLTVASVAGFRWADQRQDIISVLGFLPLDLLNLITIIPVTSTSVQYVEQTSQTNNAAGVPETIPATAKPESQFVTTLRTALITTIAHYVKTSKMAIADAPVLRGFIDTFLRAGVQEELVAMIVAGQDATPGQFDGILNTAGIQTQAFSTDSIETIRKAITKVRSPGKARATGIAMNPVDWEGIELTKTAPAGTYMFGGPQTMATPRLWGVPVTLVDDMPVGTAIVGDWRYAVLWDRESATVTLYDQNEDDAIKNMVTILGELRAGFSVLRPPAFVNADLSAA